MSNLTEHARRELALVEQGPDGDRAFADSLQAAVDGFATYQGHSGGSHSVGVHWLNELLNFRNISPLTDSPEEWVEVGHQVWQNKRCSEAFSYDGGKTYRLLSHKSCDPFHDSVPA